MDILRNLFGFPEPPANSPQQTASPLPSPAPIHRRVMAIIHNPVFRSRRGQKAQQVFGWNDPDRLAQEYIADIRACSAGYANFEIAERIEVDGFPVKRDGFVYTEDNFLQAWQSRRFHDPDGVDYLRLVRDFNIFRRSTVVRLMRCGCSAFPTAATTSRSWRGREHSGATRRHSKGRSKPLAAS